MTPPKPLPRQAEQAAPRLDYLRAPFRPEPLGVLLLLGMLFATAAEAAYGTLALALAVVGLLAFLRMPRWLCHLAVAVAVVVFVGSFVFSIANGPHDPKSVRDEAVELAAQRFLAGENPWSARAPLDTPITSGPASVLLAAPAVAVFGRVNELSFAFYLAFLAFLFAADARRRNGTFVPLSLLVISGFLGFQHTLYWSLEELYWAYAVLALVPPLLERNQIAAAGACVGFAFCSRVSYAFPLFAFLCWWWFGKRPSRADIARLAAGAIAATALIVLPFALVGGSELAAHNPFTTAGDLFSKPATETSQLSAMLNAVSEILGPVTGGILKIAAALAIIVVASMRLASPSTEAFFWHLCLGAFVANFLVYRSQLSQDYALFFAVPAFLATAVSRGFGIGIGAQGSGNAGG